MNIFNLIIICAPMVAPDTMAAIIQVESSNNPYAIGVVGGQLIRQPKNKNEAIATAKELEKSGWNYSVGIAQINKTNFKKYGLSIETAFEPCLNIKTGGRILQQCYRTSLKDKLSRTEHIKRALSCYYSGKLNSKVGRSYANRVFRASR